MYSFRHPILYLFRRWFRLVFIRSIIPSCFYSFVHPFLSLFLSFSLSSFIPAFLYSFDYHFISLFLRLCLLCCTNVLLERLNRWTVARRTSPSPSLPQNACWSCSWLCTQLHKRINLLKRSCWWIVHYNKPCVIPIQALPNFFKHETIICYFMNLWLSYTQTSVCMAEWSTVIYY